ncbi:hypothetical protein GCM10012275_27350 [Longimycelium tulufanense]|uniref:Uncharacterized protein n=1 Tax=Longimycelium tulufanense TaxID=907463 RepID=A0A8J3C8H4_9PSEU|nr:hypothetical protein [Longimycelium tulufanense]GGM54751.1 hypothetical protein GCM10012275_27350 [Longimycelium tulufanense]
MRRLATLIGAGGLVLLATACANEPRDVGFGASPPPVTSSAPSTEPELVPRPPEGGNEVPKGQVDVSALPEDYPRLVWLQGDDRTVGVHGQEGGCGKVSAAVTEQSAEKVRLHLTEKVPANSGPCTMDLRYPSLTVSLDQPLGDRTVVVTAETVQE